MKTLLQEFQDWHTKTSMRNWGKFPKNLGKSAKLKGGTWYWKGHSVPDLYLLTK